MPSPAKSFWRIFLTLSILVAAGQSREFQANADNWYEFIQELHRSPDPVESNSD